MTMNPSKTTTTTTTRNNSNQENEEPSRQRQSYSSMQEYSSYSYPMDEESASSFTLDDEQDGLYIMDGGSGGNGVVVSAARPRAASASSALMPPPIRPNRNLLTRLWSAGDNAGQESSKPLWVCEDSNYASPCEQEEEEEEEEEDATSVTSHDDSSSSSSSAIPFHSSCTKQQRSTSTNHVPTSIGRRSYLRPPPPPDDSMPVVPVRLQRSSTSTSISTSSSSSSSSGSSSNSNLGLAMSDQDAAAAQRRIAELEAELWFMAASSTAREPTPQPQQRELRANPNATIRNESNPKKTTSTSSSGAAIVNISGPFQNVRPPVPFLRGGSSWSSATTTTLICFLVCLVLLTTSFWGRELSHDPQGAGDSGPVDPKKKQDHHVLMQLYLGATTSSSVPTSSTNTPSSPFVERGTEAAYDCGEEEEEEDGEDDEPHDDNNKSEPNETTQKTTNEWEPERPTSKTTTPTTNLASSLLLQAELDQTRQALWTTQSQLSTIKVEASHAWEQVQYLTSELSAAEAQWHHDQALLFRHLAVQRFGSVGPHYAELHLSWRQSNHDKHDNADNVRRTASLLVQFASLDLMPATVYLVMQQMELGLWDHGTFYINAPHVLLAQPSSSSSSSSSTTDVSSLLALSVSPEEDNENPAANRPLLSPLERMEQLGLARVPFAEYSEHYPHVRYSLGLGGRLLPGPNFFINKIDNTDHHVDQPCFAHVVAGRIHKDHKTYHASAVQDIMNELGQLSGPPEDPYYLTTPIEITSVRLWLNNNNNDQEKPPHYLP
ncbi:hypothetical protein ACA910_007065 [Epithemia clementina (nom. ined.)]